MADEARSLRSCFIQAEAKRKTLEVTRDTNSATFQENLISVVSAYEECLKIIDQVSLISQNESLDDVSSGTFSRYFLIHAHLAELLLRITGTDRKAVLLRSRTESERHLKLLDSYDLLSREDSKTYEQYLENPNSFSTASTTDAAARRQTKIARFKEEKALKYKIEHLRRNPAALQNDEAALRDLHLTQINLHTHLTFQSLESVAQELQILALAPPSPPQESDRRKSDERSHNGRSKDEYSDRLDGPLSQLSGQGGPILSKDGRPLRPFTLLDSRQRLQQGVFRPDHNLPTMTIDEYLEEEKKRGGIIEGGGSQSEIRPEPDEDNFKKADEETTKARQWDDYKEENPRGSGNTMNMG